jgi:hypothetical protein
MSSNNSIVITFSIAILLFLALLLLVSYNSKCKLNKEREYFSNSNNTGLVGSGSDNSTYPIRTSVATNADKNLNTDYIEQGIGNIKASNPLGDEQYDDISNYSKHDKNSDDDSKCFKKDRLTSSDLLPKDGGNSKWSQINPTNSGDVRDQNYLTAGYHIGVNTIGQSLRNANLQLRSEIPNPQVPVSPWMISTIEPDVRPVSFEIGSSPTY